MAEIEVKKTKKIEEGKHHGIIEAVETRTEPYDYTDYMVKLEMGTTIKYGVPTDIYVDEKTGEPENKHAKLLKDLGFDVKGKIDPEKAKGLKVSCMIIQETTKNGTFARIVDSSLKVRP